MLRGSLFVSKRSDVCLSPGLHMNELLSRIRTQPSLVAVSMNSAWLLGERIFRMLLSMGVGVVVSRYLGPSDYGHLSFVYAYLALFQAIVNLGIDGIVVRDLSTHQSNAGEILGSVLVIRLSVAAICWASATLGLFINYGFTSEEPVLGALAGGALFFQAFDVVDLWFQSLTKSKLTVIPKLVTYVCSTVVKLLLVYFGSGLFAFAFVFTFDAVVTALGLCVSYRFATVGHPWKVSWERSRGVLLECWPYLSAALSVTVYMRIHDLLIVRILGYESAGLFAAASPLATAWYVIPTTLCVSLAPYVARVRQADPAAYWRTLLLIFRVFGLSGLLLSVLTALFATPLVTILYGSRFAGAGSVVAIYVFATFFVFQGMAQSLWIINEKAGNISLYKTLIGAAVAIVLDLILLPRIGIVGAAVSAVVAQAASSVLSNVIFSRRILLMQFGIEPLRS
jgi:O-antigen/teichoic acid export membrane protein